MTKQLIYKDKYDEDVELNADLARKVLTIVDKGLVGGMGKPVPGKMCVEAAVCFAMNQYHGDKPPCVHEEVQIAKVCVNDMSGWPNKKARARGLRAVAIAQLGSDILKDGVFTKKLYIQLRKQVLIPTVLRLKAPDKLTRLLLSKDFRNLGKEVPNEYVKFAGVLTVFGHELYADTDIDSALNVARGMLTQHGKFLDKARSTTAKDLQILADCILEALKACKSPGVKFLELL